jgi:protein-S-isoprenylcysteine O-methyltransferase Ste14
MIQIGNFFYKYRNTLFILLYLALFIPSPPVFSPSHFGANYYLYPIIIGLIITIAGQLIRGATIGLAYIIRGGKDGKVHAEDLVTKGIFNHCRNPLYIGNILMLAGVGILSNSLLFLLIFIPFFAFVYYTIVLAEENFLRNKFGQTYIAYSGRVNRWLINFRGIGTTFKGMQFKWKRWILKEYNTQYVWLSGITLIILFRYRQVTNFKTGHRNHLLIIILSALSLLYLLVRYLKKSGKMVE